VNNNEEPIPQIVKRLIERRTLLESFMQIDFIATLVFYSMVSNLFSKSVVKFKRLVVEILGDAIDAPLAMVHDHLSRCRIEMEY